MGAKTRRTHQTSSTSRDSTEVQDIFRLHQQASRRRDELLDEVLILKAAGDIREARRLLREAKTIQMWLRSLEEEVRSEGDRRA
jgi:hypothetical protein